MTDLHILTDKDATVTDCDTQAIDKPFLEGSIAFLDWTLSKRKCLDEPENPYDEESRPFEWNCWEVGFSDAHILWRSWQ